MTKSKELSRQELDTFRVTHSTELDEYIELDIMSHVRNKMIARSKKRIDVVRWPSEVCKLKSDIIARVKFR